MLSEDDHNEVMALLGLHPHVDHAHDVISGADSSPSGKIVDVDKRIPRTHDGLPLWRLLTVHEEKEGKEEDEGKGYKSADLAATKSEKKAAETLGVPWAKYEETINGYLSHIEGEKAKNPPRNALHVSPRRAVRSA